MSDNRIKTTLEYKVDDKALKGLDQTLHRAFDEKMLQAFERSLERSARHIEALTKAAGRLEQQMRGGGGGSFGGSFFPPSNQPSGGGGGGRVGGGTGGGGGGSNNDLAASIRDLSRLLGNRGGGVGSGGGNPTASRLGATAGGLFSQSAGGGFYRAAVGAIPLVGGVLGGAMDAAGTYYQAHVQQQALHAAAFGAIGTGRVGMGNYGRYGLDGGQARTQFAEYARGAGMTGSEMSEDTQNTLLDAQFGAGISGAGLLRAQGTSGGSVGGHGGGTHMLQQAITAGMVAGVNEARLPEFIEAVSSQLDSARMEGADLSAETIEQLTQGLARMGLGGERAQSLAGSTTSNLRHLQPSGNTSSMIALRAAGLGQPGVTYSDAMRRLQEHPDEVMENAIGIMRQAGGGRGEGTRMLMRTLGPQLTGQQLTESDIDAYERGSASGLHGGVGTEQGADFLARRRAGAEAAHGTSATEARYRDRQAHMGGQIASQYRGIRDAEMHQVEMVLPTVMTIANELVTHMSELLDGIYDFLGITRPGHDTPGTRARQHVDTEAADQGQADRDLVDRVREELPTWMGGTGGPAPGVDAPAPTAAPDTGGDSSASASAELRRVGDAAYRAADHIERMGTAADGSVAAA